MRSDNRELWDIGKKVVSEVTYLRNSIHVGGASKEHGRDNTSVPRTHDALENTQKK